MKNKKEDNSRFYYYMRGRVALYEVLRALGVGKGDEIIIQGFTCLAVPMPIMLLKAVPVYVDIARDGYSADPAAVEKAVTEKTRAIVVQHTFGIPADMDKFVSISRKYNIPLIEDCCHAMGSCYRGEDVGSFGTAAFYSTEWAKPVNTGIGGILKVNDAGMAEPVRKRYEGMDWPGPGETALLRAQYIIHGALLRPSVYWTIRGVYRLLSRKNMVIGTFSREELDNRKPPYFDQRMSTWQKSLLERKCVRKEGYVERHRAMKSKYDEFLREKGLEPLVYGPDSEAVLLRYPLMVRDKEGLLARAREKKVEIGNWFVSPVHPKEEGQWGSVGYEKGKCPEAERKAGGCVNLPMHRRMGRRQLDRLFDLLSESFLLSRECASL